jgi:Co/Zn/Cd efflux system component
MDACCEVEQRPFDGRSGAYRRALWAVLALNAGMFALELGAGWTAASQALKADALDFLADTATYAVTLWAIGAGPRVRAGVALLKGASLSVMAAGVLAAAGYRVLFTTVPHAETMGGVALLALLANLVSVALLLRYRNGDANVRSVWLCSRNDAIGNVAVVAAAAGVWGASSAWPDLLVAAGMAGLFFWSSAQIVLAARRELRLDAARSHREASDRPAHA